MTGKADVAGKDLRTVKSLMDDRQRRDNLIGLTVWMIVMLAATLVGFFIGFIASN
jgi:hypothetical protein